LKLKPHKPDFAVSTVVRVGLRSLGGFEKKRKEGEKKEERGRAKSKSRKKNANYKLQNKNK
jgi:hypothetical protein